VQRLLFISSHFPVDVDTCVHGVYQRMQMLLEAIGGLAKAVDVLFFVPPHINPSSASIRMSIDRIRREWCLNSSNVWLCPTDMPKDRRSYWESYGPPMSNFLRQRGFFEISRPAQIDAFALCLDHKPDAILVHHLEPMCPLLLTQKRLPPVFLDLDDIEHIKFLRSISQPPIWLTKRLQYLQVPALLFGERRAIKLATRTFVCSKADRDYLSGTLKLPGVVTVPNSVAIPLHPKPHVESKTLLFLGSYTYGPNWVAADFLITRIWPIIHRAVPEAKLVIAGNLPERIPSFSQAPPGVSFPGFVGDLNRLYESAQIVCCPIHSGGGTRIKLIEAAAHGKAMVATRIGAEGLELRADQDIIIRDGAQEFARACIELLFDPRRCQALGRSARELATRTYDRKRIIDRIRTEIDGSLEDSGTGTRLRFQ
jgi:glycosyltransferase involved in cell wall biosynthesis